FDTIVTFGECSLKSDTVLVEDSIISILLAFFYQDTVLCSANVIENSLIEGAAYKIGNDSIRYYISLELPWKSEYIVRCDTPDCKIRLVNPLQPEVVDYIKKNKN